MHHRRHVGARRVRRSRGVASNICPYSDVRVPNGAVLFGRFRAPMSEGPAVNSRSLAALFASVAVLTACGGGGSSSDPASVPTPAPSPSPSYDAQGAWSALLTTNRAWTVAGRGSDGADYQLALTVEPVGADVFPVTGASAVKSILRNRLARQAALVQDVTNEQYTDPQYRLLGSRISTDGGAPICSKTDTIAAVPPTVAAPGSSGPLYAATTLSDCTAGAASLGTSYHTWSMVAEGATVFLCIASSNRFIGETSDRVSETCVETDASGRLGQRARITLTLPGFSVVATN